jgi:hypothetical protein
VQEIRRYFRTEKYYNLELPKNKALQEFRSLRYWKGARSYRNAVESNNVQLYGSFLVQNTTSNILIAFLSGIVLAGGTAYVVSNLHKPAAEPVAATAPVKPQAAATQMPDPPAPAPAEATQTAAPESQPHPTVAEVRKPKPHPMTRREARQSSPTMTNEDELQPAPQPVRDEVAQNTPPPAPAVPPAPQPAVQALNPPPGTQTAPPPVREPKTVTLTAGMPITVRINENISSNTNYEGDTFTASLDKPIVIDGFVIADRGSRVLGKVLRAEKAGRVKGRSELSLALTQIHTTDGQTVAIQTTPWDKEGPNSKKRDAAEMAGGAALGAIIGAIAGGGKGAAIGAGAGGAAGTGAVLVTRGKAAEVPSETRLTFSLSSDVAITERLH